MDTTLVIKSGAGNRFSAKKLISYAMEGINARISDLAYCVSCLEHSAEELGKSIRELEDLRLDLKALEEMLGKN